MTQQTAYITQPYAPPRPTNALAVVSLVLSLIGISLGGVICGHIALGQVRRTGEAGHGLALAGVIVGYVGLGMVVLFIAISVVMFLITGATFLTLSSVAPAM